MDLCTDSSNYKVSFKERFQDCGSQNDANWTIAALKLQMFVICVSGTSLSPRKNIKTWVWNRRHLPAQYSLMIKDCSDYSKKRNYLMSLFWVIRTYFGQMIIMSYFKGVHEVGFLKESLGKCCKIDHATTRNWTIEVSRACKKNI